MLYVAIGSPSTDLTQDQLQNELVKALDSMGPRSKVLAIPPDFTRYPSQAGILTSFALNYFGDRLTDILPATGTHHPLSADQITQMFPGVPHSLFRVHDWRNDLTTLGVVEPKRIEELSEGKLNFEWPAQVNRLLVDGGHDLILSIGQVVPHEVIGMANYNKNIFVGTGGADGIAKSHWLGATFGIENTLGRIETPVRRLMNDASNRFGRDLPIAYVLTVIEPVQDQSCSRLVVRGLFVGDDEECYTQAAELSAKVNITLLAKPVRRVVAYMDASEYHSTWVGNKAIYRTRMIIADDGELLVLAPGVSQYGEAEEFDRLIARHGYRGTEAALAAVKSDNELAANLGVAAHLIHGSSEGRFRVRYAAGELSADQIASVGFEPVDTKEALDAYDVNTLRDGMNTLSTGEEFYYVSNPGLGLWALTEHF